MCTNCDKSSYKLGKSTPSNSQFVTISRGRNPRFLQILYSTRFDVVLIIHGFYVSIFASYKNNKLVRIACYSDEILSYSCSNSTTKLNAIFAPIFVKSDHSSNNNSPNYIIDPTDRPKLTAPNGLIGAYFPISWPPSRIPEGYFNLATLIDVSGENAHQLTLNEALSGHKIIMKAGQCVKCTEASTMRACLGQKLSCRLSKSEVCFTEIRVQGKKIFINRGCQQRTNCQRNRDTAIAFNLNNQDYFRAKDGRRPEQQCWYLGARMAEGKMTRTSAGDINPYKVNDNQKCRSCHRSSFGIPYL